MTESARKKILIIDDDKIVHAVLKLVFEKAGYQVFGALDAMQGIMSAKQVHPDLIVLDIMMPAGGGFAVYERLQMMAGSFQVPFLVYSSAQRSVILSKIPESPTVIVLDKTASAEKILQAATKLLNA
jgi:CheY-like chemotaxis protein